MRTLSMVRVSQNNFNQDPMKVSSSAEAPIQEMLKFHFRKENEFFSSAESSS